MKKLTTVTLCCAFLAAASLPASAASIRERTLDLDARFAFEHTSVSIDLPTGGEEEYGATTFYLNAGLGYFVTSRVEIIGDLLVDHSSVDEFDVTGFGLGARGQYHFPTEGGVIPFVGLGLGFVTHGGDLDNDETEFFFPEISGGVRVPFEDVVAMNFSVGYRHRFSAYGIEEASGNEIFLGFGISVFLQGGVGE